MIEEIDRCNADGCRDEATTVTGWCDLHDPEQIEPFDPVTIINTYMRAERGGDTAWIRHRYAAFSNYPQNPMIPLPAGNTIDDVILYVGTVRAHGEPPPEHVTLEAFLASRSSA